MVGFLIGPPTVLNVLKSSDKVTIGGIDMGQGMHTRCAQDLSLK